MGKIRKAKPSSRIKNVSAEEIEEDVEIDSKENVIQTVLDQLQSANVEEKYCGLQTFSLLTESQDNIEPIISRGVVKTAAPLLLDTTSSVRNAASGALRNLSTVSLETCEALLEQDVMTPLVCYFHEHAEKWASEQNASTKRDDSETFIHCVNLLWNLCESSEMAIKYLGQSRILDILPKFLDLQLFGADVVASVLQCLFVVVEDNALAMEKVKSTCESALEQLLALEGNDPDVILMRTLAAGVTINTCGGQLTTLPHTVINNIISILGQTLSVDHRMACNQLSSAIPLKDGAGKVTAPKGKEAEVLEKHIKSLIQLLDAQQNSVEIIANICSSEGDDSMDDDESTDSEEINDEEMCNGTNGDSTLLAEDKLSPDVLEAFTTLEIFDKVWARTQLPPENVVMILKEYDGSKPVLKKLQTLQTQALLCINNMISSLPIDNLGSVNGLYKIWVDAGKLVFKQNSNDSLLESATAVMRAALDKIKLRDNGATPESDLFKDMALSDIEIMVNGIRECEIPEIRSNLIRMIGILALLLTANLNETTSNVAAVITEFILEQAHKEHEVWVLAEALDTIIDLYSEDETDQLAARVKLLEKLAVLAPLLKSKARQQRKLPKEYKALVSTVTSNLPRFIKYKKGRLSSL